jgi:VanZ family protein
MTADRPHGASRSAKATATLAWLLAFAYSLAPFTPALPVSGAPGRVSAGEVGIPNEWWVLSLLVHLLVFAAIGVADRLAGPSRDRSRPFIPVPIRGIFFCGLIELSQIFFAGRHAETLDLTINVLGFAAGYLAAGTMRRRQADMLSSGAVSHHAVRPGLMVMWGVLWFAAVLLPARLVALDSWDAGYPLMIGNENGGGRAWAGELRYVAFYDRALSKDEVARMHSLRSAVTDGSPWPAAPGLLAAYDFTLPGRFEVAPIGQLKRSAPPLTLPKGSRWSPASPSALVVEGGSRPIHAGAGALSAEIAVRGAFSVEAWFQTESVSQTGPARIVSISDSPWRRNVMLGQEGQALHFRVRNQSNGENGTRRELVCANVLGEGRTHIVAAYNHGVSTIFRNGTQACPAIDLREPSVLFQLGAGPVSAAVTAALAAISWIAIAGQRATLVRILLTGYGWLLLPLAVSPVLGFRPAASLYIWFGPAVLLFWLALTTRRVMWTPSKGIRRRSSR